jgi:hypothetical protein
MAEIKEIHQGAVVGLNQSDFQIPHEPTGGKPEIIPHQHNGLDMLAIALAKRGDQFGVLIAALRMEPLLELIEDKQHLPLRIHDAASP